MVKRVETGYRAWYVPDELAARPYHESDTISRPGKCKNGCTTKKVNAYLGAPFRLILGCALIETSNANHQQTTRAALHKQQIV